VQRGLFGKKKGGPIAAKQSTRLFLFISVTEISFIAILAPPKSSKQNTYPSSTSILILKGKPLRFFVVMTYKLVGFYCPTIGRGKPPEHSANAL